MARLELETASTTDVVSLATAKSHLRVTHDADDTLITNQISAATEMAENYVCSKFIDETYKLYMEDWGDVYVSNTWNLGGGYYDTLKGPNAFRYGGYFSKYTGLSQIVLPFAPLSSVTHIKYYDTDNSQQTWSDTNYNVFKFRNQKGFIEIKNNIDVPSLYPRANAIEIQFVCGYGSDATSTPTPIAQAILLIVGHMYEKREDTISRLPKASEYMLDPYRIKEY